MSFLSTTADKIVSQDFYICVFFFSVFFLSMGLQGESENPHFYSIDGEMRYLVTKNLVEKSRLAINENGEHSIYGILPSLLAAPLFSAGMLFDEVTGKSNYRILFTFLLNPLFGAFTCLVLWKHLIFKGYRYISAFLVVLMSVLSTPFWVYTKTFFSEPVNAFLLTMLVFYCVHYLHYKGKYRFLQVVYIACITGLLGLSRPELFLLIPIILLWILVIEKKWLYKKYIVPALKLPLLYTIVVFIFILLQFYHNFIRYGSYIYTAYQNVPGFTTPLHVGLAGLILSPGKGLLFFCPTLIISFLGCWDYCRKYKAESLLLIMIVLTLLILYSKWFMWFGGICYGPRFLIQLLPLLYIPSVEIIDKLHYSSTGRKMVIVLLIILGVVIHVPGILYHPHTGLMHLTVSELNSGAIYFKLSSSAIIKGWYNVGKNSIDLYWLDMKRLDIFVLLSALSVIFFKWRIYPLIRKGYRYKPRLKHGFILVVIALNMLVIQFFKTPPDRGVYVAYYSEKNSKVLSFEGIRSNILIRNLKLNNRLPDEYGYKSIWKTILTTRQKGRYGFVYYSDGNDLVELDKTVLFDTISQRNRHSSIVYRDLKKGQHLLSIIHRNDEPIENVSLSWVTPGDSEIKQIPSTMFHLDIDEASRENIYGKRTWLLFILITISLIITAIL